MVNLSFKRFYSLMVLATVVVVGSMVRPAETQRLCGKALTQTLALVCHEYPSMGANKRTKVNDVENTEYSTALASNWHVTDQNVIDRLIAIEQLKRRPHWMNLLFPQHRVQQVSDYTGNGYELTEFIPDRFQTTKRGIVEECCHRPCTLEYLKENFCAVPATN